MKSLYASMVITGAEGWGDGVPVLWIAEDLYNKGIYQEIFLWDGGNRGLASFKNKNKFFHRDFIEKPYFIKEFLDGPPDERKFDKILSTSFRTPYNEESPPHEWAVPPFRDPTYGQILPPALYISGQPEADKIHYSSLNDTCYELLCNDNFVPTLPTIKGNEEYSKLIESFGDFVCIMFRKNDPWGADLLCDQEFDSFAEQFIVSLASSGNKVLVISDMPSNITSSMEQLIKNNSLIDGTNWPFWTKIYAAKQSRRCYSSHSGFGLIISGYIGYKNIDLINAKIPSGRLPPVLCFSNGRLLLDNNSGELSIDIAHLVSNINK